MKPFPQRTSLAGQVAAVLRECLAAGEWQGALPGEMDLCRRFQVSRAVLRAALASLQSEGLLRVSQGRRREVVGGAVREASQAARPDRVVLLSPVPHAGLTTSKLLWIDELRGQLAGQGVPLEFVLSAAAARARPGRVLRDLVGQHPAAAWVLLRSTSQMQQWFAAQGLPAVVAGSRGEGVHLPGVDTDYQAACRHAAGRLLARGCTCLGLVLPRSLLAGDRESEIGFQAGAAGHPVRVARHDGSPDGLCRALESMMKEPLAPQGLLVCHSTHAVTALGHLIYHGWKVPQQVKLIARDDDPFLEHVAPLLSRYALDPETYARHVARHLRRCLEGAAPAGRMDLLLPQFREGKTG